MMPELAQQRRDWLVRLFAVFNRPALHFGDMDLREFLAFTQGLDVGTGAVPGLVAGAPLTTKTVRAALTPSLADRHAPVPWLLLEAQLGRPVELLDRGDLDRISLAEQLQIRDRVAATLALAYQELIADHDAQHPRSPS